MLNAIKILTLMHSQLNNDRLTNVNKVVNTPLGKEMVKRKTTPMVRELPTEHLLGRILVKGTRK